VHTKFCREISREKNYLEDLRVNGNRKDLREIGSEVVEWIHLALDRNQWRDVINMAINFGFHKSEEFLN
jgi:hypothetical protein